MENNQKSLKELFAITRGLLIGRYSTTILACVIIVAIELVIIMLTGSSSAVNDFTYIITIAVSLITDLLMGILVYGQSYFFLKLARQDSKLSIGYVFYGLKNNIDKAILVQSVFTLASFVSLIPIILVNMGYMEMPFSNLYLFTLSADLLNIIISLFVKLYLGLSFYILCDHPEYTAREIFAASCELMANKKGRLVKIYLCLIPLYIVGFFACCIGILWVTAFSETLMAIFYLDCIGEDPFAKKVSSTDQPDSAI